MNLVKCLSSRCVLTGWLNRGGLETSTAEVIEEVASPGTKESQSTGTA